MIFDTMTIHNNSAEAGITIEQLLAFIEQHPSLSLIKSCSYASDDSQKIDESVLATTLKNVSLDSRKINKNDLFIAIQGENSHGLDFLKSILEKSPGLVVCDRLLTDSEQQLLKLSGCTVTVLSVHSMAEYLGELAAWFYKLPSQRIKVVGITGTNGKTSTAFYCAQLLDQMGEKVALMGTLGNGPLHDLQATANTTPDSVQVQRLLSEFAQQGIGWCVMEVSSHALCLGRVQAVEFATVALTQVTRDHMDFHKTIEGYQEAKTRLFLDYKSHSQVLNMADSVGRKLFALSESRLDNNLDNVWTYQPFITADIAADDKHTKFNLSCQDSLLTSQGIETELHIVQSNETQVEKIAVPLMGLFSLENLSCALSILLVNKISWQKIQPGLLSLKPVLGRMQRLATSPTILLDFAHTPDALEQVLKSVKLHLQGQQAKLWLVFGCGGNRDKGKRPLMGKVAEHYADYLMVTSDNPRDEQPIDIINDILQGLQQPDKALVEQDRILAIQAVLQSTSADDIVLIAGKGHENYQEILGVKHPYSDSDVVKKWLEQSLQKGC